MYSCFEKRWSVHDTCDGGQGWNAAAPLLVIRVMVLVESCELDEKEDYNADEYRIAEVTVR